MNLEKADRKSRRSSILKPPKLRQPFQNVELAISSAENSPATTTTKVKRRVSFAEKKHVKEFCDSMEQGTVWDNTYEESELSQLRNSENSNTDENIISNENKRDSMPIERDINLDESMAGLAHTKPSGIPFPANHSGSFHARRSLSATERAFGTSLNKETPFLLESSDPCPARVSAITSATGSIKKSANIVSPVTQDVDCNNISMDATLLKNLSVEPKLRTSFNVLTTTNFLKTDPISIAPMELNDCQSIRPEGQGGIIVYQDTSMEITEAISNRVPIISKHQEESLGDRESGGKQVLVTEKKTTFQIKPVDTVTKILGLSKKNVNEPDRNEVDLRPERMPTFHNKSEHSRNTIQSILSSDNIREVPVTKTTIYFNEPVDLTEVVQNIQRSAKPENIESKHTTVLHEKSFAPTEVIPSVPSTCLVQNQPSEKTTIFHDKSMDFTSIVQNLRCIKEPSTMSHEQTTLFHNKSLDFTEVARSDGNDVNLQASSQKFPTETIDIHDQSMNITAVMQNSSSTQSPKKAAPEKTMIFQNQPVDMTEVVRDHQSSEKHPPEETEIFPNQSMHITEVVRSHQIYKELPPEKTTIFHDQSKETTEIVRSCRTYENPSSDKTTIFHNQSVDITEVVHGRQSYVNPPPEKTTIFHDQSIDMTEVVRSRQSYVNPPPEKTTIFHDQSIDMTEVVSSRQIYVNPPPEKITIFHDQSIEMTEVVRSSQSYVNPSPEKTRIFHDQSIDITEVVRSRQSYENLPPKKTTIFHDRSVSMTELVQNRQSCDKLGSAEITSLQNQSVDMIGAWSNSAGDKPVNPDKTAEFPDKSIDSTEIKPSVCLENPIRKAFDLEVLPSSSPRTTFPDNTSAAGYKNPETVNGNKTSESISRVPNVSKLILKDSCPLAKASIPKQKTFDSEEANELNACIDVKTLDPEIRSPIPKRMKSLGSRQSLDLTAAVPFVTNRKLARQRPGDMKPITCNLPDAQVHCGTVSTNESFCNISLEVTEVPADSINGRPAETVTQEPRHGTTNFENRSMEMTESIPFHNTTGDADLQRHQDNTICHDSSMEITKAIPGILKVNTALYHDDSMELTKAVSRHPITEKLTVSNGNRGSIINLRSNSLPTSESETMVFRDEPMELTNGSHLSSQPIEKYQTNVREFENPCAGVIAGEEKDSVTMVYHDDSMELTRAVQFPLQARAQAKENCPPGMEYLQSRSFRRPEKKSSSGISRNEWLEIMKSMTFESAQENKENKAGYVGSEIQSRTTGSEEITGVVPFSSSQENKENEVVSIESEKPDSGSDDITGVVAFAADLETQKRDGSTFKEARNAIDCGVSEMEMTEGVRWSSHLNVEKPVHVFDYVDRQSGLPSIEMFPSPDKIQHRHSQVAKELFQKPVASMRNEATNENSTATSEAADLDAEIRKLAETFALSNSVDESGFDQATFLRQQARCMEDYEANSTASQEFHSGTMSAKSNMSIIGQKDSLYPNKSICLTGPATNPNLDLLTKEIRVISPDSKNANILIRNNDNAQCNGPSKTNGEDYDRSLEELRCRAYSVSKFQPEVTGFELTGAISLIHPANLHKSIFDEEPPSYVFSDSVTTDSIANWSATADVSSTKSAPPVVGMEDRMSVETSHVSVSISDIPICVRPSHNNKELEIIGVAEEIITRKGDHNRAGVSRNKNVIKRPSIDPTISVSSSSATDTELQRERLSGQTTAAEFSSESPEGPNEKIRRRESGSTTEERTLPAVDKVRNETELTEIARSWGTKTFANSTVIGEDHTRQFSCLGIEETSILLDRPHSNELLSGSVHDDDQMVNNEPEVEKAIEITTESEHRFPTSPCTVLKETLNSLEKRSDTIWRIERLDQQMFAFSFFSRSLIIAIYLKNNAIWNSTDPVDYIDFLSQLKEDESPRNMCLAHRMIMKKISCTSLTDSCKTYEDIPRMLEYVTAEIKLGMDFMFELDRLSDHLIMEVNDNSITFTVRTRDANAGIILNITIQMKPFDDITPDDITIAFLLGREKISENDIKRLITNVKRDHRFLRFYINDVRTYIDLIAESGFSVKNKTK